MTDNSVPPAERLEGLVVGRGWKVTRKIARPYASTGGYFSQSYVVESEDGVKRFLKALDFSKAMSTADPSRALQLLTEEFNFERDIMAQCGERKMSRVVRAIDDGTVSVGPTPLDTVQFIVFELAEGDVRLAMASQVDHDAAWRLRVAHNLAVGLMQLHKAGIAHQDLKPSNVLMFPEGVGSKVGDLGRSTAKGKTSPNDGLRIAGDMSYAPPELLYSFVDPDWRLRRIGCDIYLLGSMVVFLFSELSMTAQLMSKMTVDNHWQRYRGAYSEVLPLLRDAFALVLDDFRTQVPESVRDGVVQVVRELCDPDPSARGNPQTRTTSAGPLDLERYVSRLNMLAKRAAMDSPGGTPK